jgi:hypothetical protein
MLGPFSLAIDFEQSTKCKIIIQLVILPFFSLQWCFLVTQVPWLSAGSMLWYNTLALYPSWVLWLTALIIIIRLVLGQRPDTEHQNVDKLSLIEKSNVKSTSEAGSILANKMRTCRLIHSYKFGWFIGYKSGWYPLEFTLSYSTFDVGEPHFARKTRGHTYPSTWRYLKQKPATR